MQLCMHILNYWNAILISVEVHFTVQLCMHILNYWNAILISVEVHFTVQTVQLNPRWYHLVLQP